LASGSLGSAYLDRVDLFRDAQQMSRWVNRDRSGRFGLPVDVRFAPKATEFMRRCNVSRRAKTGLEQAQQGGACSITSSASEQGTGGPSKTGQLWNSRG